jgi:hypothetical protein
MRKKYSKLLGRAYETDRSPEFPQYICASASQLKRLVALPTSKKVPSIYVDSSPVLTTCHSSGLCAFKHKINR